MHGWQAFQPGGEQDSGGSLPNFLASSIPLGAFNRNFGYLEHSRLPLLAFRS